MAKYLLLRSWLVFLKTRAGCGLPTFLKGNHQLESRMQEICQSGSEGGAKLSFVPTPIINGRCLGRAMRETRKEARLCRRRHSCVWRPTVGSEPYPTASESTIS